MQEEEQVLACTKNSASGWEGEENKVTTTLSQQGRLGTTTLLSVLRFISGGAITFSVTHSPNIPFQKKTTFSGKNIFDETVRNVRYERWAFDAEILSPIKIHTSSCVFLLVGKFWTWNVGSCQFCDILIIFITTLLFINFHPFPWTERIWVLLLPQLLPDRKSQICWTIRTAPNLPMPVTSRYVFRLLSYPCTFLFFPVSWPNRTHTLSLSLHYPCLL